MTSRLTVLGAGSWGTALAMALAPHFDAVHLWARDPERAAEIGALRENRRYLPGFRLPANVRISGDLAAALNSARILLTTIPSAHLRDVLRSVQPHVPSSMRIVSATKGLEEGTLLRMSEVIAETLSENIPL